MIGRTNVGGGGNTFALIVVTYPAGSVCTCSDGTRTIRAKGTTGSFVFNIPYAGTWTVNCTDGTNTANKNVIVSSKTSYDVLLTYGFVLYDYGTENVEFVNTKYTNQSGIGVYENFTDHFYIHTDGRGNISITRRTTEAIDISSYSTLKVYGKATGDSRNAIRAYISNGDPAFESSHSIAYKDLTDTLGYQELDVSNITGKYYIGIGVTEDAMAAISGAEVYKILLE